MTMTTNEYKEKLLAKIKQFRIEEDKLRKELALYVGDYNFPVNQDTEICSLANEVVWSDHDSSYGQYVYGRMLFLDTYDKPFEQVTDLDVDEALRRGQAVSVDDLSLNDLDWLLGQLSEYQKHKPNRYKVITQVVDNEFEVSAEATSYHKDFRSAKKAFHEIEEKYAELGYDLDDDTKDYDEGFVKNGDFFNNATNEYSTIRIYLEEV